MSDVGVVVIFSAAVEPVKLVIWDLDETFWRGTLSEGGIVPIQENIDLVIALSARGIVNSICSKNHFEPARAALTELGIWEHFIFPRIAFAPKGAMIAEIIEAVQLRAPSILFVDDNVMNLNEALHYSPGLQIAEPGALPGLLDDPRCKGKPDPTLERLTRYKVLEQKQSDQSAAGGDNTEFLRNSQVRISFHHDVLEQFPRIHDLINRTNQLNFTKRRWPEDETEAREQFKTEFEQMFGADAAYIKVADRYGNYGICGFYLTRQRRAFHFLFSCRAMNMGVEQFVWNRLQKPAVRIAGEVISRLEGEPDWISVVDDADTPPDGDTGPAKPSLCIRGACDMMIMTHYLRAQFEVKEEFQFPYQGWGINPVSRLVCLADAVQTPAGQALIAKTPGIPPNIFNSAIVSGSSDIYIISFASELFPGMYRSRSTGLVLPFAPQPNFPEKDFAKIDYDTFNTRLKGQPAISRKDWEFMGEEYEFVGHLNKALLSADLARQFEMLRGKTIIVFMLNTKFGSKGLLTNFARINGIVRPIAETYGCHIIDLNDFVRSTDDLASATDQGAHFKREVYIKLAQHVGELCATQERSANIQ